MPPADPSPLAAPWEAHRPACTAVHGGRRSSTVDRAGLFGARATAWALLLTGWLALGSLGAEHATALPGGAATPLIVWLLAIGGLLASRAGEGRGASRLAAAIGLAGLGGAVAVAAAARGAPPAWTLGALALAWAALTVGASRVVHGWRQQLRRRGATALPSPGLAALVGGAAAWAAAGDLLAVRHAPVALGMVLAAGVVAALVFARAERRHPAAGRGRGAPAAPLATASTGSPGCRAGLFDCSLPLPAWSAWRDVERGPLQAAALVMLPMMVALPAMVAWCSQAGWSPRATVALHLAAMLVPGVLARPLLARCAPGVLATAVTALLAGGVAALAAWPGLTGLMAMSLLHALAWSLAWGGTLAARGPRPVPQRPGHLAASGLTALAVAALSAGLAATGPATLAWAHATLAAAALAASVTALLKLPRHAA